MKIPIIQRNEKIPFSRVENRELNLALRKTTIIVIANQAVFVKHCPDFKVFSPDHEGRIKIHFLSNVLHG